VNQPNTPILGGERCYVDIIVNKVQAKVAHLTSFQLLFIIAENSRPTQFKLNSLNLFTYQTTGAGPIIQARPRHNMQNTAFVLICITDSSVVCCRPPVSSFS
jgi:hypothetical protein